MISRAPHRLFLRGQLRPSHTLQRRLRAKIILTTAAIGILTSIVLTTFARPQYPARIVIDTGDPGCEHGMIYQRCGGCDHCIPFSSKLKNLASNLKRALE